MAISQSMQDWVSQEINERLEGYGSDLRSVSKGKRYAGGWRSVSVDVHIQKPEQGLILALDPKHLQSRTSVNKNWKNMLNDLVAFSGNLHSRFPSCVVGGIVAFNKSEATQDTLKEMYSIIDRVAVRQSQTEANDLMEGFAIVIYDCDRERLVPDTPPRHSKLRSDKMFERMAELVVRRYVPVKGLVGAGSLAGTLEDEDESDNA
jgi:hypothetical protein